MQLKVEGSLKKNIDCLRDLDILHALKVQVINYIVLKVGALSKEKIYSKTSVLHKRFIKPEFGISAWPKIDNFQIPLNLKIKKGHPHNQSGWPFYFKLSKFSAKFSNQIPGLFFFRLYRRSRNITWFFNFFRSPSNLYVNRN